MPHVSKTDPPSFAPPSKTRPHRRPRIVSSRVRLAATFLLLIWAGPVTFVQTDSGRLLRLAGAPQRVSAESRVIPAGRAMTLPPGALIHLRLRDGTVLNGRFLGRAMLDSTVYAARIARHADSSSYAPLAMGETLHVSLQGGSERTGVFAGYGELTLLLRTLDEPQILRVSFEYAKEIRRANGERVDPVALAQAFRAGQLPSAEALALVETTPVGTLTDQWASALRVPAQDIASVTVDLPSQDGSGTSAGTVVGVVILSVALSVVLVYAMLGASIRSSTNRCGSASYGDDPNWLSGIPRTTRPFDRYRGCYEGDVLVAEAWTEPVETIRLADAAPSRTLTR